MYINFGGQHVFLIILLLGAVSKGLNKVESSQILPNLPKHDIWSPSTQKHLLASFGYNGLAVLETKSLVRMNSEEDIGCIFCLIIDLKQSVSVCLCACLRACLSVCLPACVCPSVCLWVDMSVCQTECMANLWHLIPHKDRGCVSNGTPCTIYGTRSHLGPARFLEG